MADEARKIRTVNETESSFETTGSSGLRCVASDTGNWLYVSQDGTKLYKSARQSYKTSGVTTYLDNDFNDVTVRGDCLVAEYIKMFNDTNNSIRFRNDQINIYAGGVDVVDIQDDAVIINEDLTLNGTFICDTINTGQGAVECYAMNQDVETTDAVTFSTINTGQGAVECYAMNQDVETTDAVQFSGINITANASGTILSQVYNSNNTTTSAHALHSIATGGSSAGNPLQRFLVSGDVNGWVTGIDAADSNKLKWTNPYNDFTFAQAKMTLTIGGSLGIGTTSPASKLQINHDHGATEKALALRDATYPTYGWDFDVATVPTGDMYLTSVINAVEAIRFTFERANGRLGIGTTTPASKLSVEGSINQEERVYHFTEEYSVDEFDGAKDNAAIMTFRLPSATEYFTIEITATNVANSETVSRKEMFSGKLVSNTYTQYDTENIFNSSASWSFVVTATGSNNDLKIWSVNNDVTNTAVGMAQIKIFLHSADSISYQGLTYDVYGA